MSTYLSAWPSPSDFSGAHGQPKISIVTPNFNEETTLERTMLSVLNQNYPALEYIVIDDGSTDSSVDIIRRHESRLGYWETHQNAGQYSTINTGFEHATGEIFGWLNSDDIYLPWTLHVVGDIFSRFPEVDWIMGLPATIQDGIIQRVRPNRGYPQDFLRLGLFSGSPLGVVQQESTFWRRRLWEKAGPLDPTFRRAADYEIWTRFAQHAPLVCCDLLLTGFTRTGKNRSVVHADAYLAEVADIQRRLGAAAPADLQARQRQLLWKLDAYEKFRHSPLSRLLAIKALGLDRAKGPTLLRDFRSQQYALSSEACLVS